MFPYKFIYLFLLNILEIPALNDHYEYSWNPKFRSV